MVSRKVKSLEMYHLLQYSIVGNKMYIYSTYILFLELLWISLLPLLYYKFYDYPASMNLTSLNIWAILI